MKVALSNHTQKRMRERNITLKNIQDTIDFPDYTVREGDKIKAHKKIGDKSLRIVYTEEDKYINVITVMFK